jgi:hypothetical protein
MNIIDFSFQMIFLVDIGGLLGHCTAQDVGCIPVLLLPSSEIKWTVLGSGWFM